MGVGIYWVYIYDGISSTRIEFIRSILFKTRSRRSLVFLSQHALFFFFFNFVQAVLYFLTKSNATSIIHLFSIKHSPLSPPFLFTFSSFSFVSVFFLPFSSSHFHYNCYLKYFSRIIFIAFINFPSLSSLRRKVSPLRIIFIVVLCTIEFFHHHYFTIKLLLLMAMLTATYRLI